MNTYQLYDDGVYRDNHGNACGWSGCCSYCENAGPSDAVLLDVNDRSGCPRRKRVGIHYTTWRAGDPSSTPDGVRLGGHCLCACACQNCEEAAEEEIADHLSANPEEDGSHRDANGHRIPRAASLRYEPNPLLVDREYPLGGPVDYYDHQLPPPAPSLPPSPPSQSPGASRPPSPPSGDWQTVPPPTGSDRTPYLSAPGSSPRALADGRGGAGLLLPPSFRRRPAGGRLRWHFGPHLRLSDARPRHPFLALSLSWMPVAFRHTRCGGAGGPW